MRQIIATTIFPLKLALAIQGTVAEMLKLFIVVMLLSISLNSFSQTWSYHKYKDLHSASIRLKNEKLKKFGLSCSNFTKGIIKLSLLTTYAPTHPRKGQYGYTTAYVDINDNSTKYILENSAGFPELLESVLEVDKKFIHSLKKGREVVVSWERWNGRIEVAFVSLKNSSAVISKFETICRSIEKLRH